ncbi:MAG: fasciclin domain-containing protein [Cruoricaptor ignavus]|nr:fasciclin domain-containing protein [Cruoricaptor ignavus]
MRKPIFILALASLALFSCKKSESTPATEPTSTVSAGGQESVIDEDSAPDIVKLAVATADLSTLVKAVNAAGLATSLSNAGPFTVFAPVNEAFDKLPAGTLDNLMKPENKGQLEDILGHHTYVGVLKTDQLSDGQNLGMVDGKSITIKMVNDKPTVNGTVNIIASVPASNGIVHLVDGVILPE